MSLLLNLKKAQKLILLFNNIAYETFDIPVYLVSKKTVNASKLFKLLVTFKALFVFNRGDVVLSFMTKANFINILSKWISPHKVIISERTYSKRAYGETLIGKGIRWLYPHADKIVANSKAIRNSLIIDYGIAPEKIMTIYNGINLEKFITNSESMVLSKEEKIIFLKPVIISIGRLDKYKNIDSLIRAFSKIRQGNHLVILGDGEERKALINLTHSLNLEQVVFFLGKKDNPECFLKHASLFVLSSCVEGFPNVVLEAMACGLPVISTDCLSGPRELLAPNTNFQIETSQIEYAEYGVLVPSHDAPRGAHILEMSSQEREMGLAIQYLLDHPEISKKYIQKSLERAQDFDIKKIAKEWKSVIDAFN